MSASLYELTANYTAALDFLTDPENEVDQQTLLDTLEGLDGEIDDKLANVGKFILTLENQAEGIAKAEKNMAARRKALENRAAQLRDYAQASLIAIGKQKVSTSEIALSLAKLPPSVTILDESLIPFEFQRAKIEPDKSKIKEAGGCPGAIVESKGYRLSIK